jgi:peptide-methionine (S)-S-oxide reductase
MTAATLWHASDRLDRPVLAQNQHCQAESPTFDICLVGSTGGISLHSPRVPSSRIDITHRKIKTMSTEKATFAGGCFWCTEAVFKRLKGVASIESGYAASQVEHPSYKDVCSGKTGAAEAIQLTYDPAMIAYETLLDIFWHLHDPTTLNKQGNDVGTQYRSAIFYHNDAQKQTALASKEALGKSGTYKNPVVTEIEPFTNFYAAEDYHKDYYDSNRLAPYCTLMIDPKVQKLLKSYSQKVKDEYKN